MKEIEEKLRLRDATPEDSDFMAGCILASVGEYDFLNRPAEYDSIVASCMAEDTLYSYRNAIIATVEGTAVGVIVSYAGDNYLSMKKATQELLTRIIGGVGYGNSDQEAYPGEYYLDSMAISPKWRGYGIGHILMENRIEHAKKLGFERITLIVNPTHTKLQEYYAKLGFEAKDKVTFLGVDYTRMVLSI